MRKKIKKHHQKNPIFLLAFFLFVLFALTGITKTTNFFSSHSKIASNAENTLQIGTFGPTTAMSTSPSPTPGSTPAASNCAHDTGFGVDDENCSCVAFFFQCKNNRCARYISIGGKKTAHPDSCVDQPNLDILGIPGGGGAIDYWCNHPTIVANGNDGKFLCMGKPVIYLYPEKNTLVDVSITTTGQIVVSDPIYPTGGWKDVLAEPGGKLTYNGKNYTELFYEAQVKDFEKPKKGLGLTTDDLKNELDIVITKLGLIGSEKTEFLDWWVPRLQATNSKYIFFSIIEKKEKEKIDHVSYSPEPATRIEFIAYFKPLSKPYEGDTLILPPTPQRIGFTAVEWGGILDN